MKNDNLALILKLLICFCCLNFLSSCSVSKFESIILTARVERAISGQTLEVSIPNSERHTKVRIIGIDAPDLRQSPWGSAARERLTILNNHLVELELETKSPDSFDRLLAHVWHNKSLVSEQSIEEGFVLANTKYPHKYSQRLLDAQEYARLMGYGIWNPQQPMRQTPQQFRIQSTAK